MRENLEMREPDFRNQKLKLRRLATSWHCRSKGANVEDELPALLFRKLPFERGHGFSAFAYLVKNLAVRNAAHVLSIDQARRRGIVACGVWSIAFSSLAMALRAFIHI